ncbi:putative non-transporter ABC protein [Cavenderia fasciculata]|uniref:Non-transporter ABC protein n=1 Tax=Cavenderia fasciculata TaxID=261658 RepID=F4Q1W3_CACFS|nr:putative non-transporter ABC protein [Cavenderia fasciculata]EGG17983.1 putative non-transporter ABC protein [Cavenderia fasciculata]|eukprot:XP_004356875.1 putative non-transporter ABC protein [Cavenderia fasciculata]
MKLLFFTLTLCLLLTAGSSWVNAKTYCGGDGLCQDNQLCFFEAGQQHCADVSKHNYIVIDQIKEHSWIENGVDFSMYKVHVINTGSIPIRNVYIGADCTLEFRDLAGSLWSIGYEPSSATFSLPKWLEYIAPGSNHEFGYIVTGHTSPNLEIRGIQRKVTSSMGTHKRYAYSIVLQVPLATKQTAPFQDNRSSLCSHYSHRDVAVVHFKEKDSRVEITHRMSTNTTYSHSSMVKYVMLTVYYVILDNIHNHLIKLVSAENQLFIRRMVMEKLLYSEIGAFDFMRKKNNIGPLELEFKISSSISSTISFFTYTIPDLISSAYAFAVEGSDLLKRKNKIDPLIILHPILIAIYQKVSQRMRELLVEGNEIKYRDTYQIAMSRMIGNTFDGLSDIQINNLQETQLSIFDNLIEKEMGNTTSWSSLVSGMWRSINNRSVFEFAVEVFVAHKVMLRQGIDNQEYRTMLLEINRIIRLARRVFGSVSSIKNILKHQKKVKKLLDIPTFIEEDDKLKCVHKFNELKISNVKYAYENKFSILPSLPVLDLQGEMTILPGKKYALVGQNRAGKSTLNHILCKIYSPQEGTITFNGIPYEEISRRSIRRLISYVSQRPSIFPGTVRDNIRVGNPDATEDQIIEAAAAAGVFAFAEDADNQLFYDDGVDIDGPYQQSPSPNSPCATSTPPSASNPISSSTADFKKLTASRELLKSSKGIMKSNLSTGDLECLESAQQQQQQQQPPQQLKGNATGIPPRTYNNIMMTPTKNQSTGSGTSDENEESSKLVQRVWSVLNLASMNDDDESDDETNMTPPPIVPPAEDYRNHPILDQMVELGGKNVSGGFGQSIALARIFVRTEAKIVILDETMSQMDAFKKREIIFPKLFQFAEKHNITLIIVTHDLMSIQNAVDHIFVLDHGHLVGSGSHQQLVSSRVPVYMKLLGFQHQ